ncbi:hypothetical protein HOY81_08570, partial [Streptomyces sp. JJ36]|nr:hypothetical protein [Streptomyces sp. JJ36]
MTDTGQVPGEGQPDRAAAQPDPQQPGAPAAHDAYGYPAPADGPPAASGDSVDEEDLLMPGAQGAWSEAGTAGSGAAPHPPAAGGTHESDGRDSGVHDVAAARAHTGGPAPEQSAGQPPRRPLHLGPPVPEQSGAVRSLADRGPSAPPPGPAAPAPGTQPGPQGPAAPTPQQPAGPEYLDVPSQGPETFAGPQPGQAQAGPHGEPQQHPGGSPAQADAWTATPVTPGPYEGGAPAPGQVGAPDPAAHAPLPGPDLAAVPPPATPGPHPAEPVQTAQQPAAPAAGDGAAVAPESGAQGEQAPGGTAPAAQQPVAPAPDGGAAAVPGPGEQSEEVPGETGAAPAAPGTVQTAEAATPGEEGAAPAARAAA